MGIEASKDFSGLLGTCESVCVKLHCAVVSCIELCRVALNCVELREIVLSCVKLC